MSPPAWVVASVPDPEITSLHQPASLESFIPPRLDSRFGGLRALTFCVETCTSRRQQDPSGSLSATACTLLHAGAIGKHRMRAVTAAGRSVVQLAEHQHDSNCFLLHTGLEQDGRGHSHSAFAFVLCNFPKSSPKMQIGRTTLILYFCMLVDLPSTI